MSRNPDRDFSADELPEQEQEDLRALLRRSEVADLFDTAVRERIGKLISRAVFNPAKPGW
jgi:hypothetical protein